MQIRWLIGILLLLVLFGARVSAVQYIADQPISLDVRTGATSVAPGHQVQIRIAAFDVDQADGGRAGMQRVDDPVTLTYEATGGQLSKRSVTQNPVDLVWLSPTKPGYYAIFITAQDSGRYFADPPVRRVIELRVEQQGVAFVPTVRVGATPQTIQLDRSNSSSITAQLLGEGIAGKGVRFFSTGGTLSAVNAVTNNAGLATVRLTVRKEDVGTLTVAAVYGNTVSTTTVQVVERTPGPVIPRPPTFPPLPPGNMQPGFVVSVEPPSLPADGRSTAIVRIRMTDIRGLPLQRQSVFFRSTIGVVAPRRTVTDNWGYATAEITASDYPGGGYVVVTSGAVESYAPIVMNPVDEPGGNDGAPRIFLTLDPTRQMADGASRVYVEALVLDERNRAVRDQSVSFTTTLGRLAQAAVRTDEEGKAGTSLIAPDRPGLAVVTATVGRITAASQVAFEGGGAGGPQLEIAYWSGQNTSFVAPNWLLHEMHVDAGGQGATTSELKIYDRLGKLVLQVPLGTNGVIVRDQYGLAHGYCFKEDGKSTVVLLKPSGELDRTIVIPLAIGSDIQEVKYADPGGQVLVSTSRPDGTEPDVRFYSPAGAEILAVNKGLERLPEMALGADGYLAMALPGGTVRIYSQFGQLVAEGRRADGLQATHIAIGPGATWVAVAASLAGQTERRPVVSVFSQQGGAPLATFELEANQLVAVSNTALAVSTPERTVLINVAGRNIAWQVSGSFERFLAVKDVGILAGHHGEQGNGISSRITVVRLRDGQLVVSEPFAVGRVVALTPPGADGIIGVLGNFYALGITLPQQR